MARRHPQRGVAPPGRGAGRKRKGVRYFGPYGNAGAIRSTLDLLVRSFPVRTCSDTKFIRHERLGRPCLLYDIDRCSGPCVGAVDHEAYDGYVNDLMGFLSGDTEPVLARLEAEMLAASEDLAVRARRPPARPHRRRAQGGRVPADGLGPGRGLRRGGDGRGPAGGVGADLPGAPGPRGRAPGLRGREGGGPVGARVHGAGRGPGLRGRRRRGAAPHPGARGAGRPGAAAELAAHRPRRARSTSRCPSAAPSGRCRRR